MSIKIALAGKSKLWKDYFLFNALTGSNQFVEIGTGCYS